MVTLHPTHSERCCARLLWQCWVNSLNWRFPWWHGQCVCVRAERGQEPAEGARSNDDDEHHRRIAKRAYESALAVRPSDGAVDEEADEHRNRRSQRAGLDHACNAADDPADQDDGNEERADQNAGMMPAANRAPTEMPPALASTIIMMLGGMILPMVELTALMAAAKAGG